MSAQFTPGDKVVCIDAKPRGQEDRHQLSKLAELQEGTTYTIKEAYDWRKAGLDWSLILVEIDTPFPLSWRSNRFAKTGGEA